MRELKRNAKFKVANRELFLLLRWFFFSLLILIYGLVLFSLFFFVARGGICNCFKGLFRTCEFRSLGRVNEQSFLLEAMCDRWNIRIYDLKGKRVLQWKICGHVQIFSPYFSTGTFCPIFLEGLLKAPFDLNCAVRGRFSSQHLNMYILNRCTPDSKTVSMSDLKIASSLQQLSVSLHVN